MADFSNYKKTNFAAIKEFVETEKPEFKDTLKQMVEENKSFLTIKKEFYKTFFPQFIPKRKATAMKKMLENW